MPASPSPVVVEPRFRIQFGPHVSLGPGKAALLEQIHQTGSITDAAKAMGMSYMRAWKLVKSMDVGLAEPLVRKTRGGRARGGAELTPTGLAFVRIYRQMEAATHRSTRALQGRLQALASR